MSTQPADDAAQQLPPAGEVRLVGIGRGLSHTLRIRIVIALLEVGTELSSTDLARRLGISLGKIDYHVKCLLALGIIESAHTRQGRGSRQHFYALAPEAREAFSVVVEHPLLLALRPER